MAEAELRRSTAPGTRGQGPSGRLPLVAQALIAVGAVDAGTADQIQAGLDLAEHGTILHLHAGGVTMEDDWAYYRAVRPLPTLWIRDSAGRWHATCDYVPKALGEGEVTLELTIVPPLEAGTRRIDVVAAGRSARVRARLPLCWTWNP